MPESNLILYQELDGAIPLFLWLDDLPDEARTQCLARIRMLIAFGHELRRPVADYLRDGIYELRISWRHVQYRILYFFFGRSAAVVLHGLIKRGRRVPPAEIDLAIRRKRAFESNPEKHTSTETI